MLLTYHIILNKALILTGSSIFLSEVISSASQAAQWVKNLLANAGDVGLISGLGRSPGGGQGYPFQYFGLENSIDCIVHGVAELDTTERLSLLEKEMATHSSILAWRIPRTEEPGGLQSIGLKRVGHN